MSDRSLPFDMMYKRFTSSSGAVDMNVAASSTATVVFKVAPDTSRGPVEIHRVLINMVGLSPMLIEGFGGDSHAALTNGIKVNVTDTGGTQILDFLDGYTIQENSEWTRIAGTDAVIFPATSAGAYVHQPVRWTISNSGVPLHLGIGHEFRITIQDDISSSGYFRQFNAWAQGHYL